MNFILEKIKLTEEALKLASKKSEIQRLNSDLLHYKHLLLIDKTFSKKQIERQIEQLENKIEIIKNRQPKNPEKKYPEIKKYKFQLKNLIQLI